MIIRQYRECSIFDYHYNVDNIRVKRNLKGLSPVQYKTQSQDISI
ncbi:IS3 family transposase [Lachnoclostridium sp.]